MSILSKRNLEILKDIRQEYKDLADAFDGATDKEEVDIRNLNLERAKAIDEVIRKAGSL